MGELLPSARLMPDFLAEVLTHNRHVIILLRTAKEWRLPPTAVLRHEGNINNWEEKDFLLATALQVLDAETCASCGTPAWLGHSTNNHIQFNIEDATCYGCLELGKAQEERNKSKSKGSKEHGKTYYPVAHNVFPDKPLPTRRQEYERRSKRK